MNSRESSPLTSEKRRELGPEVLKSTSESLLTDSKSKTGATNKTGVVTAYEITWKRQIKSSSTDAKDSYVVRKGRAKSSARADTRYISTTSEGSNDSLNDGLHQKSANSASAPKSSRVHSLDRKSHLKKLADDAKNAKEQTKPLDALNTCIDTDTDQSEVKNPQTSAIAAATSKHPAIKSQGKSSGSLSDNKDADRKHRRFHNTKIRGDRSPKTPTSSQSELSAHLLADHVTLSPLSPKSRSTTPTKKASSQRDLIRGGEQLSVIRKATNGTERKRTVIIRRKLKGGDVEELAIQKQQPLRRRRQARVRQVREDCQNNDRSPGRPTPLRKPSGDIGALLDVDGDRRLPGLDSDDESVDIRTDKSDNLSEKSPRNDALTQGQQKSPRHKVGQRVRAADMRQIGKHNVRQLYLSSEKSGAFYQDEGEDTVSRASRNKSQGIPKQPAQLEIALDMSRQSAMDFNHSTTSVSTRLLNVTKSPFLVAGKLLKKATSTAGYEVEYGLPAVLPMDEVPGDDDDDIDDAIKKIEAIGITTDQLELLKKAGLKITPS